MNAVEPNVDLAWDLADEMERLSPESRQEYNRHEAQIVVSGVLARVGLADSARSLMERARPDRELDPTAQLVLDEAAMRVLVGDHDEAIDLWKQWLAAHPDQDHGLVPGRQLPWRFRALRDHPRIQEILRR